MSLKNILHHLVPKPIFSFYHLVLAWIAAFLYGFPSRQLIVIGVTGTKGKSSTIEYLNAIFEEAGHKTALASTIRIKIGDAGERNLMRMTMAGRFFLQKFLSHAVRDGCTVAFVEMTSEGARQHRHRGLEMDALIFLNLAPEHIESHGSLQAYADAKFELGHQLARSKKRPRYMLANVEDPQSARFLQLPVEHTIGFSLQDGTWETNERGGTFAFEGTDIHVNFPGKFSLLNALAAATLARWMEIKAPVIARGILNVTSIPGRAERVEAGQDFPVIVDYAHTPDSLRAIYGAYNRRRICVLGSTGGGRDMWKRPVMGSIADEMCDHIILTNEDPYDEDPRSIVEGLARGITKHSPEILMDRREAIQKAISLARASDVVLITGKGTDPCICGPRGTKLPWSDSGVAREELEALVKNRGTIRA
ncbi:UDP-N-acetylmuramyl-tripeptide synthetase [Candidatus Kaiserbacteria bacterium]|nr:UDP-N-acetylmuramyl-tripeptide synthetase [Candidatus Kaiserbacteria bacterium]